MLSRNSIFLKLIGSFYEQVGSTKFLREFDNIYSGILYQRYADIVSKSIAVNKKSAIFNSVRLGFINPYTINVSTGEIELLDIKNNNIEDADYISPSLLNADKIYMVRKENNKLFVDNSLLEELVNIFDTGYIPVLYGTIGITDNAVAEWISIQHDISGILVKELGAETLETISKYILYTDDSVKKIDTVANILLGAIYSYDWEKVLKITDDFIYTTKNQYKLNEVNNRDRVIVNVGDELQPMTLITRLSEIETSVTNIPDVKNILSYMNGHGLSVSNFEYLFRLSREVAKRKIVINVFNDVISSVDRDTLSVMANLIKTFAINAIPNSKINDTEYINIDSTGRHLAVDTAIGTISISGKWILDVVITPMNVEVKENESIDITDSSNVEPNITEVINGDIFLSDKVNPSERTILAVTNSSNGNISGHEIVDGILHDTNFSNVDMYDNNIFSKEDNIVLNEPEYEIKSGDVSFYDEMIISETGKPEISIRDLAVMWISDTIDYVVQKFEVARYYISEGKNTDIKFYDFLSISDNINDILESMDMASIEEMIANDDYKIEDKIFPKEMIKSYATYGHEDMLNIVSDEKVVNTIHDVVVGGDLSYVESDVNIDD